MILLRLLWLVILILLIRWGRLVVRIVAGVVVLRSCPVKADGLGLLGLQLCVVILLLFFHLFLLIAGIVVLIVSNEVLPGLKYTLITFDVSVGEFKDPLF